MIRLTRRGALGLGAGLGVAGLGAAGCATTGDVASSKGAFQHGIASGDPTQTSVLIWTRVTPELEGPMSVAWGVARDSGFKDVVKRGTFNTGPERDYTVKILEHNKHRCEELSTRLEKALVLQGDVTDELLLEAENVEEMDLFVAVTNDDENNIMSCLLAKRMGARRVVALINRRSYVDLLQSGQIDIAISPAQATIGTLLAHVRRGDITEVHSLRRGAAEALEAVVHGDAASSRLVGRQIEQVELPKGTTIAALVRGEEVLIAHHDLVIQAGDHAIVFVTNKKMVPKVEKLFQVSAGFL